MLVPPNGQMDGLQMFTHVYNPNLKRMINLGVPPPISGNLKLIIFRQLHEVDTAMGGVWVFGQPELRGCEGLWSSGAAQGWNAMEHHDL